MPRNAMSQLQSSLLLGLLYLIPTNTLRYTVLALAAGLGVIYAVHLKRPTVQLSKLEETIKETEELIREAKILCPRDLLSLTEAGVRLLESVLIFFYLVSRLIRFLTESNGRRR